MRDPSSLERSQRRLYLAVKKELALFERSRPKNLISYEKAFRNRLPKRLSVSERSTLLKEARNADVILVGDFHPFRQSQKGFLRFISGAMGSSNEIIIALECFQITQQNAINEYLHDLLTAEELREKIDFEKHWPFAWESYKEILTFARSAKIPVIALNIPEGKQKSSLKKRDEAAAEQIALALAKHPEKKIFVLYGELHLGQSHLPAEIRRRMNLKRKILTVHQNNTDIFWKTPLLSDGQKPEVVRLGTREFCILNSVPWVKLRAYLDWLEGGSSREMDEENLDIAGLIHHYAHRLGEALNLKLDLDHSLEIFPPDRLLSSKKKIKAQTFNSVDRELALHSEAFARTGYLPGKLWLLLPTISTNSLSEAASHLLRHSLRPSGLLQPPFTEEGKIAHFLLGYLGSKILNPKRKCNEIKDLRFLSGSNQKSNRNSRKGRIAARSLFLLSLFMRLKKPPRFQGKLQSADELEACRAAGFVLGERYFLSILRQPEFIFHAANLFKMKNDRGILREVRKVLNRRPVRAQGKLERF